MLKFDEWYFPDGELHLPDWMRRTDKRVNGRLAYQYTKYEMALGYTKNFRVAVDVGAHVGLWSWYMARDFKDVAAFEPMQEHRACWIKNMEDKKNAELYPSALSDKLHKVKVETRTAGSSGDTGVIPNEVGEIDACPLDHFNLQDVDFIKIDCEGYELPVLKGAVNTIEKFRPCIVVEQKGDMAQKYGFEKLGAVKFLTDMGYKLRGEISGDYILSWG